MSIDTHPPILYIKKAKDTLPDILYLKDIFDEKLPKLKINITEHDKVCFSRLKEQGANIYIGITMEHIRCHKNGIFLIYRNMSGIMDKDSAIKFAEYMDMEMVEL